MNNYTNEFANVNKMDALNGKTTTTKKPKKQKAKPTMPRLANHVRSCNGN